MFWIRPHLASAVAARPCRIFSCLGHCDCGRHPCRPRRPKINLIGFFRRRGEHGNIGSNKGFYHRAPRLSCPCHRFFRRLQCFVFTAPQQHLLGTVLQQNVGQGRATLLPPFVWAVGSCLGRLDADDRHGYRRGLAGQHVCDRPGISPKTDVLELHDDEFSEVIEVKD